MRLKKTLAFALAIAMVFGLVSMVAAAPAAHGTAFGDVAADHPKAKQITALGALGIAVGDGGLGSNFNPDGTLTRAEFAVFAVRLAGQEASAKALASISPGFSDAADIPEWAWGYINVAQSLGIVIGDDQGNFNAGANVTYAEALTMLVRVTGWQETVIGTVWPTNYMQAAISLGISKDVSLQANAPIARADMAALLYNSGSIDKPEKKDGVYTGEKVAGTAPFAKQTKSGLLSNYDPVRGTVLLGNETLNLADDVYLNGFASIAAATGRDVRVFIVAKKVAYIEAAATGVDVAGVFDKTTDVTTADGDEIGYIVLKDGTQVEFDGDTKVSLNGGPATKKVADLNENDRVEITTESGVAASVAATRYNLTNALVSGKPHAKSASDVTDYNYVPVNDIKVRTDRATITLNGEAVAFDQLAEDDVVRVAIVNGEAAADGKFAHRIDATRNKVEGTVDTRTISFKTDGKYHVSLKMKLADGTTKDIDWAASFNDYTNAGPPATGAVELTPAQDFKVTLLLNADGKAVAYDDKGVSKLEYAKLVGLVGNAPHTHAQLDVAGTVGTYKLAGAAAPATGDIGKLGYFELTNGELTTWTVLDGVTNGWDFSDEYKVVSINADSGLITYKSTAAGVQPLIAQASPIVYAQKDNGQPEAGAYLGLEGLKVNDVIVVNDIVGDTVAIFKVKALPGAPAPGKYGITSNIPTLAAGYADFAAELTAANAPALTGVGPLTVTITKGGGLVRSLTGAAVVPTANTASFNLEGGLGAGDYVVTLSFNDGATAYSASTTFKVLP